MATYTSDKHIISSDDVLPAEAVQSVYDAHDAFVSVFEEQHSNRFGRWRVGEHISWQQIGALLVMDTPSGIATQAKPIDYVARVGVARVRFDAPGFDIDLDPSVTVFGARAWVAATYTGGPLTSAEMNALSPYVDAYVEPGTFGLDFGTFVPKTPLDAIRRISVIWYGQRGT
jgi:hypothetical protein